MQAMSTSEVFPLSYVHSNMHSKVQDHGILKVALSLAFLPAMLWRRVPEPSIAA